MRHSTGRVVGGSNNPRTSRLDPVSDELIVYIAGFLSATERVNIVAANRRIGGALTMDRYLRHPRTHIVVFHSDVKRLIEKLELLFRWRADHADLERLDLVVGGDVDASDVGAAHRDRWMRLSRAFGPRHFPALREVVVRGRLNRRVRLHEPRHCVHVNVGAFNPLDAVGLPGSGSPLRTLRLYDLTLWVTDASDRPSVYPVAGLRSLVLDNVTATVGPPRTADPPVFFQTVRYVELFRGSVRSLRRVGLNCHAAHQLWRRAFRADDPPPPNLRRMQFALTPGRIQPTLLFLPDLTHLAVRSPGNHIDAIVAAGIGRIPHRGALGLPCLRSFEVSMLLYTEEPESNRDSVVDALRSFAYIGWIGTTSRVRLIIECGDDPEPSAGYAVDLMTRTANAVPVEFRMLRLVLQKNTLSGYAAVDASREIAELVDAVDQQSRRTPSYRIGFAYHLRHTVPGLTANEIRRIVLSHCPHERARSIASDPTRIEIITEYMTDSVMEQTRSMDRRSMRF